jgi:hypothetical protein
MVASGFRKAFSTLWRGVIMPAADPRLTEPRLTEPRAARLLDEVHAALMTRDYAALPTLSAALGLELDRPSEPLDLAALEVIRRKAQRNAATLSAVQRGIRTAVRRLAEIRSVSQGLVTYDRSGRKLEQETPHGLTARF